jgi:excinuclease ABC subunit A
MHAIDLRGGKTHNLKGVDLAFEAGELCAITGVSGAGKSSLAMDTLYAEGQRRFVESFSPYARQFLERLDRPPMDRLEPIAAGVAVDRRAPIKSSRSTVATMADLEPYLSALFAREAVPMCPRCNVLAVRSDPHEAAKRITDAHRGELVTITYPLRVDGTEAFLDVRESLLQSGFRRIVAAGKTRDLDTVAPSEVLADGRGQLDVVIDRVALDALSKDRIAAAVETGWSRGKGRADVLFATKEAPLVSLSEGLSCPSCARSFDPPTPTLFSYQSPVGACGSCKGFGRTIGIDWNKVIPNEELSLLQGAIKPWGGKTSQYERKVLKKYCADQGIPLEAPWKTLTDAQRQAVIEGQGTWSGKKYPGVRAWFKWLETRTYKMHVRVLLSRYRAYNLCEACDGKRLSDTSLAYRVDGLDLGAWHALEIRSARAHLERLADLRGQGKLAKEELFTRLSYLERVGLGYLTLDRQARTLSGGEAQRVSLTAALGTALTGALFVLDEPTVGLHRRDIPPLVDAMRDLAHRGNVVLVIEHDPLVIASCDRVVELGPKAGDHGGAVTFDGAVADARKKRDSATSRALAGAPSLKSATGDAEDPERARWSKTCSIAFLAGVMARRSKRRSRTTGLTVSRS